jgi:hypothetical protein
MRTLTRGYTRIELALAVVIAFEVFSLILG